MLAAWHKACKCLWAYIGFGLANEDGAEEVSSVEEGQLQVASTGRAVLQHTNDNVARGCAIYLCRTKVADQLAKALQRGDRRMCSRGAVYAQK